MANLFYARAWGLCHFLWYYDSGKHREKFLNYFEEVLKGTQSSKKFTEIMTGKPSAKDFGQMELEFEWYWDRLLARKIGKTPRGKVETPSTEAPTGKLEDDPDWLEIWKDRKKEGDK
jgi:hypothetical protein